MDFEQNNDFKTGKSIQNIITNIYNTFTYSQLPSNGNPQNGKPLPLETYQFPFYGGQLYCAYIFELKIILEKEK